VRDRFVAVLFGARDPIASVATRGGEGRRVLAVRVLETRGELFADPADVRDRRGDRIAVLLDRAREIGAHPPDRVLRVAARTRDFSGVHLLERREDVGVLGPLVREPPRRVGARLVELAGERRDTVPQRGADHLVTERAKLPLERLGEGDTAFHEDHATRHAEIERHTRAEGQLAAYVISIRGLRYARHVGDQPPLDLLGKTLGGHFRVDSLAADGDRIAVYRAVQLAKDEPVAIKVWRTPLPAEPGAGEAIVRRFREETRERSRVLKSNPHFERVIGSGITPGAEGPVLYVVAEWLDVTSIHERVQAIRAASAEPPRVDDIVALLGPAADALGFAHATGLAHGDLRAENLMWTAGDAPLRILDFGIAAALARILHDPATGESAPRDPQPADDVIALARVIDLAFALFELTPARACLEILTQARAPNHGWSNASELWSALAAAIRRDVVAVLTPGVPTPVVPTPLVRGPVLRVPTAPPPDAAPKPPAPPPEAAPRAETAAAPDAPAAAGVVAGDAPPRPPDAPTVPRLDDSWEGWDTAAPAAADSVAVGDAAPPPELPTVPLLDPGSEPSVASDRLSPSQRATVPRVAAARAAVDIEDLAAPVLAALDALAAAPAAPQAEPLPEITAPAPPPSVPPATPTRVAIHVPHLRDPATAGGAAAKPAAGRAATRAATPPPLPAGAAAAARRRQASRPDTTPAARSLPAPHGLPRKSDPPPPPDAQHADAAGVVMKPPGALHAVATDAAPASEEIPIVIESLRSSDVPSAPASTPVAPAKAPAHAPPPLPARARTRGSTPSGGDIGSTPASASSPALPQASASSAPPEVSASSPASPEAPPSSAPRDPGAPAKANGAGGAAASAAGTPAPRAPAEAAVDTGATPSAAKSAAAEPAPVKAPAGESGAPKPTLSLPPESMPNFRTPKRNLAIIAAVVIAAIAAVVWLTTLIDAAN